MKLIIQISTKYNMYTYKMTVSALHKIWPLNQSTKPQINHFVNVTVTNSTLILFIVTRPTCRKQLQVTYKDMLS